MKYRSLIKILILVMTLGGFSIKSSAQQLASQKPLSAIYPQKIKDWLVINNKPRPQISSLQNQRNLPSMKPLPRFAIESKMKHPSLNAQLPDKEKIKKLPSNSSLTVHQLANRKPAGRKPALR